MATAVLQAYNAAMYDHRAFDSLPDVESSAKRFDALTGYEHLKSGVRSVDLLGLIYERSFTYQLLY